MTKPESQPGTQAPNQQGRSSTKIEVNNFNGKDKSATSIADLVKTMNPSKEGPDLDTLKSDISANISAAIKGLNSDSRKERVASLSNLKLMRRDIVDLTDTMGDDAHKMLKAYDEVIAQGEKSNSLLKSYLENKGDKPDAPKKGLFKGMIEGIYKESSPFLKMGVELTKNSWGYLKKQTEVAKKAQKESKDTLQGMTKSLEEVVKEVGGVAKEQAKAAPTAPKHVQEPQPQAKPTAERAEVQQQPTAEREEKPSKARQTYEKNSARDADKGPVRRRGKDKEPRAKRVSKSEVGATDDAIQNMVKESNQLQANILKSLEEAFVAPEKEKPAKTNPEKPDTVLVKQLDSLQKVNNQLSEMIDFQKVQAAIQEDMIADANKRELMDKVERDEKKGATATPKPSLEKLEPKNLAGGILSALIPEILGEIIGNKLARGGIIGGMIAMVRTVGRGIFALFKPSTYVAGFKAIKSTLSILASPRKLFSGLLAAGESIAGAFKAGGVVASKASAGLKLLSKPMAIAGEAFAAIGSVGGKLSKFLPALGGLGKLSKAIPVIGQIVAIAFAVYDFFSAFFNAGEVLGKAEEAVTLWDRFSAGIGGLIGGLVGIVDSITGLFGSDTKYGEDTKKAIATFLSEMPGKIFDAVTGYAATIEEEVTKFGKNMVEGIKDLIINTAKSMLSLLPGGEFLAEKLGLGSTPAPAQGNVQKESPNVAQIPKPDPKPDLQAKPKPSTQFKQVDDRYREDISKIESENAKKEKQASQINQVNNVSNKQSTNVYQSVPLTTRNPDDSHRKGL